MKPKAIQGYYMLNVVFFTLFTFLPNYIISIGVAGCGDFQNKGTVTRMLFIQVPVHRGSCFSKIFNLHLVWRLSCLMDKCDVSENISRGVRPSFGEHTTTQVTRLHKVTEKDLDATFTCFAQNAVGNVSATMRLRRKLQGTLFQRKHITIVTLYSK